MTRTWAGFKGRERNKYNETKYLILDCLANITEHISAKEIAKRCSLPLPGTNLAITRLEDMGYIWRYKNHQVGNHVAHYIYGRLKPKGWRVYLIFKEYKEIMKYTGVIIPLKYSRVEPAYIIDARKRYKNIIESADVSEEKKSTPNTKNGVNRDIKCR